MSFTHTPAGRVAEAGPLSDAERQTRVDLAAAYRLAALNGWDDLIYTHISASVPGRTRPLPDQSVRPRVR